MSNNSLNPAEPARFACFGQIELFIKYPRVVNSNLVGKNM